MLATVIGVIGFLWLCFEYSSKMYEVGRFMLLASVALASLAFAFVSLVEMRDNLERVHASSQSNTSPSSKAASNAKPWDGWKSSPVANTEAWTFPEPAEAKPQPTKAPLNCGAHGYGCVDTSLPAHIKDRRCGENTKTCVEVEP